MPEILHFEDVQVRLPDLRVWFGDREIYPSLSEMKLLLILLSDPCSSFTATEIVTRLDLPSRQSLHVLITHLRKKLNQKYIVTLRGHGYAFARGSS